MRLIAVVVPTYLRLLLCGVAIRVLVKAYQLVPPLPNGHLSLLPLPLFLVGVRYPRVVFVRRVVLARPLLVSLVAKRHTGKHLVFVRRLEVVAPLVFVLALFKPHFAQADLWHFVVTVAIAVFSLEFPVALVLVVVRRMGLNVPDAVRWTSGERIEKYFLAVVGLVAITVPQLARVITPSSNR